MGLNKTGERERRGRYQECLVGCSKISMIAKLKIPSYTSQQLSLSIPTKVPHSETSLKV